MTSPKSTQTSRSPNGCTQQALLLLRPEERDQLTKIAQQESRSLSAMGRILLLKGIEAHGIEIA